MRPSFFDFGRVTRMYYAQTVQVCFSVSAILVFIRFLETMSIKPQFGVLVTTILAMFKDSAYIYVMLFYLAFAFSVALVGLMPQGQVCHPLPTPRDAQCHPLPTAP